MVVWSRRNWLTLAALGCLVSVGFGAFAAHGVAEPRAQELLRTGALYGFVHCLATFASAGVMQMGGGRARFAPGFFLVGVLLFSGSLYGMALGGPHLLGVVTPIGGLCFMVGWVVLAWAASGVDRA
jgi:uncharacterized membrane protein YgdD (TMEM256/DUF423 family)